MADSCLHLYGSIRASFGASTSATVVVPLSFRFRFRRLAGQNVLLERAAPQELPVLGSLEAFGRAAMCLELDLFRHLSLT